MNSDIKNAEKAQSLLDNEILQDTFTKIIDQCMQEWSLTAPEDVQRREDAWRMVKAVDKVQETLHFYINEGKFESNKITQLDKG